ncbi:MAG TPA: hypothetical protein VMV49_05245 [Candidatus Deferrimicrobium sp.]|nr:hypothetical protein [Candidatus Deferrimicrobium sp.]
MVHTIGEIPEDIRFKPYMPLFANTWNIFQTFGWEPFHQFNIDSENGCYDFFETRFNEAIKTSEDVLNGNLESPEKILSYILILPNVSIRADLLQGASKLFAGESLDLTYIILKHDDQSVFALLNGHLEGGLPVDWWFVRPDDELLERRHMKIGYKLKEIPTRIKDLRKSSLRLMDVFKDIRNERTPQWSTADYYVINAYETFALNLLYEPSSYENISQGYDGWAGKEIYGLPDYAFALVPWPQMINIFLFQGRAEFTKKVAGLATEGQLYISPFEEKNKELIIRLHSHIYDWYQKEKLGKGVPYPIQTLGCEFPNIKNKKDPDHRFDYQYPPGEWINPLNLNLAEEDFSKGVYLKVNHETSPVQKVDHSHVISIGVGRSTKFIT